jgi:hypothetical protein
MTLCMKSAKLIPNLGCSYRYRPQPKKLSTSTSSLVFTATRWSSTGSRPSIASGRTNKKGWSAGKSVALATATGLLAYVLAAKKAEDSHAKGRAYANPNKFREPKYADIVAMETVGLFNSFYSWRYGQPVEANFGCDWASF